MPCVACHGCKRDSACHAVLPLYHRISHCHCATPLPTPAPSPVALSHPYATPAPIHILTSGFGLRMFCTGMRPSPCSSMNLIACPTRMDASSVSRRAGGVKTRLGGRGGLVGGEGGGGVGWGGGGKQGWGSLQ